MDSAGDWLNFISLQARTYTSQPLALTKFGFQAYTMFQSFTLTAYRLVDTLTENLLTFQNGRPSISVNGKQSVDLVSVAFLLVIFLLSLKILDMLRRFIWAWVMFFVRMAFWAGVVSLGLYMWSRGVDGVWNDLQGGFDVYRSHKVFWENYVDDVNRARRESGLVH